MIRTIVRGEDRRLTRRAFTKRNAWRLLTDKSLVRAYATRAKLKFSSYQTNVIPMCSVVIAGAIASALRKLELPGERRGPTTDP